MMRTIFIRNTTSSTTKQQQQPTNSRKRRRLVIHWFRSRDLRLQDNPALVKSMEHSIDSGLFRCSTSNNTQMTTRRKKQQQQQQQQRNNKYLNHDPCYFIPIYCFDVRKFGIETIELPPSLLHTTIRHHQQQYPSSEEQTLLQQQQQRLRRDVWKCHPRRAQFIIDCVSDVQRQLQTLYHIPLVVAIGEPIQVLTQIISQIPHDIQISIFCQTEVTPQDQHDEMTLKQVLCQGHRTHSTLYSIWGSSTIHHPQTIHCGNYKRNLPDLPDDFTAFPHLIQKRAPPIVKQQVPQLPLPEKTQLRFPEPNAIEYKAIYDNCTTTPNYMPTLSDLGYPDNTNNNHNESNGEGMVPCLVETNPTTTTTNASTTTTANAVVDDTPVSVQQPQQQTNESAILACGETAALRHVNDYIWQNDLLPLYSSTRYQLLGTTTTTKFSKWLSTGCISSRYIVLQCRKYQSKRYRNVVPMAALYEQLLHRDHCIFLFVKYGHTELLQRHIPTWTGSSTAEMTATTTSGNNEVAHCGSTSTAYDAWCHGKTGYPFLDACMREMNATGYMSNRGRLIAASFLIYDLTMDWQYGAIWFQSQLLDYDVYINWANWAISAGVIGGKPRYYNVTKQSRDYDPLGDYIRLWVPELARVPQEHIHTPWMLNVSQQIQYQVRLGIDYPQRVASLKQPRLSQEQAEERRRILKTKKRKGTRVKKSASD